MTEFELLEDSLIKSERENRVAINYFKEQRRRFSKTLDSDEP